MQREGRDTVAAVPRIPSDVFVELVRLLLVALSTAAGHSLAGLGGAAFGAGGGYVAGGLLGRWLKRATVRFETKVERTSAVTLVAGALGSIAASIVGLITGITAVVLLPGRWGYPVLGILAWTGVFAGFQIGARKGAELLELLLPHGSLLTVPTTPLVLIDTSAAMDSRLLVLARSGFVPGELAVTRFVLDELQGLSDAADPAARRRARRGLEVLEAVRVEGPGLTVLPDEVPEREEVDAKLVALALRIGARIVTADRGLIGVAGVEGVRCLDVGLLADSLRPELVPGEHVQLRITRQGRDAGQGVGYLADGTMVVVSDGAAHLGEEVGAEVVTSVPTSKGRLYFATLMG